MPCHNEPNGSSEGHQAITQQTEPSTSPVRDQRPATDRRRLLRRPGDGSTGDGAGVAGLGGDVLTPPWCPDRAPGVGGADFVSP